MAAAVTGCHWPGRMLRADRLVLKHGKVEQWYDLALCGFVSCRPGSGLFGVVGVVARGLG
jgi:hypothetical protein